jgi:hypothetical protein
MSLGDQYKLFASSLVPLSFWWVAGYPGLVSYDSVYTWSMIKSSEWDSVIPLTYFVLVKISSFFGGTALISFIQTLLMSIAVFATVRTFGESLSNRRQCQIAAGVSLFPATGILAISVWKDSMFAPLWIIAICLVVYIYKDRGLNPSRMQLLVLALVVLAATSLRLNGFIIAIFTLIPLTFVLYRANARRMILFSITCATGLGFYLTNIFPIYAASIDTTRIANSTAPFYLDNALAWNKGAIFSEQDVVLLNSVLPKEEVAKYGNCVAWDSLFSHFNSAPLSSDQGKFVKMWLHTLTTRPDLVLESRLCRAEPNLRPFARLTIDSNGMSDAGPIYKGQWSMPNDYGLGPSRAFPLISKIAESIHSASVTPRLTFAFYWGGFWLWAVILVSLFSAPKAGANLLISRGAIVVTIGYAFSIAITNVAPDFRYMMPMQILAICLVAIRISEKFSKSCAVATTEA